MKEREPQHETIGRSELFFLGHPGTDVIFSGYGLTMEPGRNDHLVGLLMVDRPRPADPGWLQSVNEAFGECQLIPMTAAGERGLLCQMHIALESRQHIRRIPGSLTAEIQIALEPLLDRPPAPIFNMQWDEEARVWRSEFATSNELPAEIREVFEQTGYGCLAAETDIGVVHICHAADRDIEGFAGKPVWYQWQLIKMPSAPLIRLEVGIMDRPVNPYRFESFLNAAEEDQANVLVQLANQDRLYLAFYGDGLRYRFTKMVQHAEQQWQQLDEISEEARRLWNQLPPNQRDFDFAKANFIAQAK